MTRRSSSPDGEGTEESPTRSEEPSSGRLVRIQRAVRRQISKVQAVTAVTPPPIPQQPVNVADQRTADQSVAADQGTADRGVGGEPVPASQDHGAEPHPGVPQEHGTLPRFTVAVLTIGAAWLAFSLLHDLAGVIAPMFLALNLMITAYPIHSFLVRHHWPRGISAIITGLVVVLVLGGFLAGIAWSVAATITQMQKYVPQMESLYRNAIELLTRIGWDEEFILEKVRRIDPQQVVGVATSLLSDTTSVLTMIVVIITGMIFMVMDTSRFGERLEAAGRQKPGIVASLIAFASGIRRYWLVTTVFGLIVALLDWGVLAAIGVPLAAVWALFSFLTNYVPNIGFVIGVIPPAMLALFDKGWVSAVIVVAAYSVLNFVVQSIIQPTFAGDAVGLTPTLSFLSLLLWGWVFGALGTLIALPCSLLVKAMLIDPDPESRWVNALISPRGDELESSSGQSAPD